MGRKAPTPPPYKPGDVYVRPAPPPMPPQPRRQKVCCCGCCGYHWSYHLEDVDVLQGLIERDKKQQIISPPLPPDPPKPRYGP